MKIFYINFLCISLLKAMQPSNTKEGPSQVMMQEDLPGDNVDKSYRKRLTPGEVEEGFLMTYEEARQGAQKQSLLLRVCTVQDWNFVHKIQKKV
jgi:hypothetical protein